MEQLSELMSQEQNLFLPEDGLQWRAWIVPNLEGNESAIMIKGHHVLGDGLAWLLMFGAIEDKFKPEHWIQTTKVIGLCKKTLLLLLKPISLAYAFLFFLFWTTDSNFIKNTVELAGKKRNSVCKRFDIKVLKEAAKRHNVTINDVVLALTSVSLKEYLRQHNDFDAKSLNMLVPFSLREIP